MSENRFKYDKNITYIKIKIGTGKYGKSQWVEFDKRFHETKDVSWNYVKQKFGYAYDKKFSKRLAIIHGTTQEHEFRRVRNARIRGDSFGDLY